MVALASVLAVILVSLLITRVATVALTLTGLSKDAARFQARSALSGTGFTTTEAESVVDHPVRRRIVMSLMLIGSAGLVTVIATIALSFANTGGGQALVRIAVLLGGLLALFLLARSPWVDRRLSQLIARLLRRYTDLDARDYGALLHLTDRFAVGEVAVREGDWVEGRTLGELELREEGIVTLGLHPAGGGWVGSPTFDLRVRAGDKLVVYGRDAQLAELDRRRAGPDGDAAHDEAVREHRESLRHVTERDRD